MSFQITIKIRDPNKVKDLRALAQQLASQLESFTGKRTLVEVKEFSGGPRQVRGR